jgi:hypothetical protein
VASFLHSENFFGSATFQLLQSRDSQVSVVFPVGKLTKADADSVQRDFFFLPATAL